MDQQPQTRRNYLKHGMELLSFQIPGLMVGLVAGLVLSTVQMTYTLESVDKSGFGICMKDQ